MTFDELYKEFEETKDTTKFYFDNAEGKVSTRFLLIRSLDKGDLEHLYLQKTGMEMANGLKGSAIFKALYETDITINEVLDYIESKRESILELRHAENEGLTELIANFDIVNCGIETDKIDDIVKRMVRDKTIKTKEQFEFRLENGLLPKTANYVRWSFYNQITNDVIEEIFLQHERVIPTLRKIHDIDFFVKIDDEIVPFDLKITHISADFFDLYYKGLVESDGADNFIPADGLKETEKVKEFYKNKKNELNLPGYGQKSILELFDILRATHDQDCLDFINQMYAERAEQVTRISNEINKLEWWNYKYQGPRLFKNNNRFFIFLAYDDSFEDGRALKGNVDEIREKVNDTLSNISINTLHTIKYKYEKDAQINGNYETQVVSTYIHGNR